VKMTEKDSYTIKGDKRVKGGAECRGSKSPGDRDPPFFGKRKRWRNPVKSKTKPDKTAKRKAFQSVQGND